MTKPRKITLRLKERPEDETYREYDVDYFYQRVTDDAVVFTVTLKPDQPLPQAERPDPIYASVQTADQDFAPSDDLAIAKQADLIVELTDVKYPIHVLTPAGLAALVRTAAP